MSRNSENSAVWQILNQDGPILGGDLAKIMVTKEICRTEASARKIIQRAREQNLIRSTDPVSFNSSFLCYLDKHAGEVYASSVIDLLSYRPPLNRIFKTTLANNGYITLGQVAKAACCSDGSPESRTKRLTCEETITQALALDLIEPDEDFHDLFRLGKAFGGPSSNRYSFVKKLELEDELINSICTWLQHVYLFPRDTRKVREDSFNAIKFNQNWFDIQGAVYLGHRTERGSIKQSSQSFLVADILVYRRASEPDVDSFLCRINDLRNRWPKLLFAPVFISAGFSENAWNSLRKNQIAAVTTSDVFGRSLNSLLQLFEKIIAAKGIGDLSGDAISKFLEMSASITDVTNTVHAGAEEGVVANLRGTVFELIVAIYYKNRGFDVTLQKFVEKSDGSGRMEIDILAVKSGQHAILVECKGRVKHAQEDEAQIKRHFQDRFEASDNPSGWHITKQYPLVDVVFISLGIVKPNMRPTLPKGGLRNKGVNRILVDREEFMKMLEDEHEHVLQKLVERFF